MTQTGQKLDKTSMRTNSVLHAAVHHALPLPAPAPPALLLHHQHLLPPLIEILPGIQALPIVGPELRERALTRTSAAHLVPRPLCLPSIHSVSWSRDPGNPIGISLPRLPEKEKKKL